MKFTNKQVEAAWVLAVEHNRPTHEVGVPSTTGRGPTYQALVRLNRTALLITGEDDYLGYVKGGHDTLVWLVEDEVGHVIAHKSTDCDVEGFAERIEQMIAEFGEVTRYYLDESPIDFGELGTNEAVV